MPNIVRAPIRRFRSLELPLIVCAAGVVISQIPVAAQTSKPTQYDVEAAYLCQFPRFVEWPEPVSPARKTFPLCVIGQNPFGHILEDDARDEQIQGLPLEARKISSAREAADCRILFVGSSKADDFADVLAALHGAPVLTVSDMPDFISRGGIIQFVLIDSRVRFRINLGNAERVGIRLSSQLLKVAVSVRRDTHPVD
ncbi:MAG TPA: YfiR family protein [Terriglobia bacterium]|nr:YfiR family protein [Terriglobia bacterium]